MRHPIKIAVFNRHFSRKAGGAESYSVALVERFAARCLADGSPEFDVHVFAQTLDHNDPKVTYHKVPGPLQRPRWINQLLFAAYTWWRTRAGFDVIHSHENTWHGQIQTVHVRPIRFHLLAGLSGWRFALRWLKIVTSPRLAFYVWLEAARMKIQPQRVVVAVSELMRQQTLIAYPHLSAYLPVVLPGVGEADKTLTRHEARTQLQLPLDKKLILFVGNDFVRKGLPALLASLPLLEPSIHVVCVGGAAAQVPKFQLIASELGVIERVHFVGTLVHMSLAYRAADMLVHPTLEDSFAMVVLEAMSYGLPVVVSGEKFCGISAFLQNAQNALIIDNPLEKTVIAEAIYQIFNTDELRQALSTGGLDFAAKHQWQQAVDAYAQLYKNKRGKFYV